MLERKNILPSGNNVAKKPPSEQEKTDAPKSFMVNGEAMGICIMLAMKMNKTGLCNFIVKAPEDNDVDPDTGERYPDGNVRMLIEGQKDFSAYNKALGKVLKVWTGLEALGQFHAGMAASEEIDNQVNYFRLKELQKKRARSNKPSTFGF